MNTALNESRTDASGWCTGTIAGCTRTAISPSTLLGDREELDHVAERPPPTAMSSAVIARDALAVDVVGARPSAPNAIVAMIAAFAAASWPSTSAVGSGSAYPSRCASASASANDEPSSAMRVRM